MDLTLHRKLTVEHRAQFGPPAAPAALRWRQRVYTTPFMYDNVEVSDFYEIDPTKGIEFKADTGALVITEAAPMAAVTVVGSGCYAQGYNICEWWDDDESTDKMHDQLVKRQRIDHLNGIHPSIFFQLMMGTFPGLTYRDVNLGINSPVECLRAYSGGYYEAVHLGFYENTAHFRIGPPYPQRVTIRCGCRLPEVPGLDMQPRADYAIRVVEVTVLDSDHR